MSVPSLPNVVWSQNYSECVCMHYYKNMLGEEEQSKKKGYRFGILPWKWMDGWISIQPMIFLSNLLTEEGEETCQNFPRERK